MNPFDKLIADIALNTEFRIGEMIRLILKNATKITEDPTDVKKDDVILAISYETKLPEPLTTEVLEALIVLKEWLAVNP